MQRRAFLGAATAAAAMLGSRSAPARSLGRLTTGTGSYVVGQRYRSVCGGELLLDAIDQQRLTPRSRSYRLCFRGEACATLGEGTHTLSGPNGEVALFLQPSADDRLVAWFNDLG